MGRAARGRSGWQPLSLRSPGCQSRRAVDFAYQQYSVYLKDFHLGGLTCRALEDLLDLCRQERISRALLLMPEGSEFRSWYPADSWAQIDSYLQNLSRNYAAPLINAREWVDDDGFTDDNWFYDYYELPPTTLAVEQPATTAQGYRTSWRYDPLVEQRLFRW